jgi:hypothetical protein
MIKIKEWILLVETIYFYQQMSHIWTVFYVVYTEWVIHTSGFVSCSHIYNADRREVNHQDFVSYMEYPWRSRFPSCFHFNEITNISFQNVFDQNRVFCPTLSSIASECNFRCFRSCNGSLAWTISPRQRQICNYFVE